MDRAYLTLFQIAERYALDDDQLQRLSHDLWRERYHDSLDPLVYRFSERSVRRWQSEEIKRLNGGWLIPRLPGVTICTRPTITAREVGADLPASAWLKRATAARKRQTEEVEV